MKSITFLVCILISLSLWTQENTFFSQGNELYNQGKYAEAIDSYKRILDSGVHSAEVYFNLANAHYKLNNIAPSIYYYEKALQLEPNDIEIKNNRAFAQQMTIDNFGDVPQVGFSKIINNTIKLMGFDHWALLSVLAIMIFVVMYLVYYFSYRTAKKRLAFIVSLGSLFIALIALSMAFRRYALEKNDNPAIVFEQESKIKTDPNNASEELIRVHEGTKVQVLETFNDWKKVKISNGTIGWIQSDDIKLLKDF